MGSWKIVSELGISNGSFRLECEFQQIINNAVYRKNNKLLLQNILYIFLQLIY